MSHPEREYRALFERAPVALWDVDLTRMSAACSALESDVGGAPGDAPGWASYLEAHPDARRALTAAIAVRDANAAARALAGTQAGDVAALLAHVPARAGAALLAALAAHEPALETETSWQAADGTYARIRLTYQRLDDVDGSAAALRGMIGVVELAPESTPEPAAPERDAVVADLERAVASARDELARFAYVASHDMQAPLRTVIGYTDLLQRRYGQTLDEKGQKYVAFAAEGARQMRAMIEGLLALSRVLTRQREMVAVDLTEVLDEVLGHLRKPIAEAGAQVTRDALPTVAGDRTQLVQAIEQLLENALKFHGDEPPAIHVGARREAGAWVVSVSDNGLGVPADRLAAIFGPFHRLHPPQDYPGSGLGLAIVAKIAERHGGRVWAESQGRGTTFFLSLPDSRPASPPAP
jgi:signal transduction histidine kinase